MACKALGVARLKDFSDKRRAHDAVHDVIKRAQVVATTAIGAGSAIIERYGFERVLIDEASQATELATIVPLCHGCEQLVLLGDHCQLPPTVSSDAASREGLGTSLFERLVHSGVNVHMLEIQYRMHPAISRFPCCHFYAERLKDGIGASDREALDGFQWPKAENPMCFVSIHGHESGNGTSFENHQEAEQVVYIVQNMLRSGRNQPPDIGVVSPYGAQVRLIRKLLMRAGIPTFRDKNGVEVASVDGFQGREKEGIVISTVRSSTSGGIGFVGDWRRANVAFTRARRGIVVLGNAQTLLRETGTWLPWLHWIKGEGFHMGELPQLPALDASTPKVGLSASGSTLTSTPNFRPSLRGREAPRAGAQISFRKAGDGDLLRLESRSRSRSGGRGDRSRSRHKVRGSSSGSSYSGSDSGSDGEPDQPQATSAPAAVHFGRRR